MDVILPNGRRVGLGAYVAAWKTLRGMDPAAAVRGFDYFPAPAGDVLRRMREGLTDRINQRGGYAVPESRVHPSIWGHVGTPRVILYPGQVRLLPRSARARVEHRVYRADEW